ncbi:UNVERIFIED_CONTAM: hypothetical protein O8I53_13250 [Campylobacter lari]
MILKELLNVKIINANNKKYLSFSLNYDLVLYLENATENNLNSLQPLVLNRQSNYNIEIKY